MFKNRIAILRLFSSSPCSEKEVYLLRHAQSLYNAKCHHFSEKEVYGRRAQKQIHFDTNLIDAPVTEHGTNITRFLKLPDCYYSAQTEERHLFFVSPMKRTLDTAQIILDTHLFVNTQLIIIPQISEVLSKICDFSGDMKKKRRQYSHFKFGQLQKWVNENNMTSESQWQDPFVNEELKQFISGNQQFGFRYLKCLQKSFPKALQSPERCLNRSIKALQMMIDIADKKGYQRFMVISHNRVLKYMQSWHKKKDSQNFDNCQIRKLII